MFSALKNHLVRFAFGASSFIFASMAYASDTAAVDVSDIVSKISSQLVPIALIGGAVLLVCAVIYIFTPLRDIIYIDSVFRKHEKERWKRNRRYINRIRRRSGLRPLRGSYEKRHKW